MKISTLWYCFLQGLKNIRRNLLFSLASVGTIVACLFLFGIFYAIVLNFESMMKQMEESVAVTVFFEEGISEEQIKAIGEAIRVREEVNTMDYISAEEAWKNFAPELYGPGSQDMIEAAFGTSNPLEEYASYNITITDASRQGEFVKFLESLDGVRKVKSSEATAENFASIDSLVGYASIGVIVILLLVSIFLISNTITIGITIRKEEISIMKLIGATDFFVRAPFIVEGVTIGFAGSIVPCAFLYVMYGMVVDFLMSRFTALKGWLNFLPQNEIFQTLIPVCLLIGIGIGFVGSIITTRKHLKV
ncbi:MAG: permease-like cell division protein FtsX [Lachnospiraceae bacterium]|nr:permease-like cell division protein FtsX [Lachnospiraceae bacterium]